MPIEHLIKLLQQASSKGLKTVELLDTRKDLWTSNLSVVIADQCVLIKPEGAKLPDYPEMGL